jgi:SnoaL-like polyketide cyclase
MRIAALTILSAYPRKIMLISSIAIFTGTHAGPIVVPGSKTIPPTNNKFQVDFCTVAHWKNDQIDEENLFYDQVVMIRQLGLM